MRLEEALAPARVSRVFDLIEFWFSLFSPPLLPSYYALITLNYLGILHYFLLLVFTSSF
jgi:hypothetical protein